jgi:UTP:GlnB (protein PII) uridylyltransferase
MLRLFEIAAARHVDLHPGAVAAVSRHLRLVDDTFRTDPRARRSFFAVLLDADDPRITLRAMTEAGLLGAYIPEFGDIVARTQFNMYHRFTVDEHTLNALGLLREIEQGKHAAEHPLVTSFLSKSIIAAPCTWRCCCTTPARARAISAWRARRTPGSPARAWGWMRTRPSWSPG